MAIDYERRAKRAAYMREYKKRNPEYHREQNNARNKQWRRENREWFNFSVTLNEHGITLDQYHAMFEAQEERCAICGESEVELVIDHCHATNKVRGLLCRQHNMALGLFKDTPHLFDATREYVGKHQLLAA